MKLQDMLFFWGALILPMLTSAQSISTQVVQLDANKSIFLKIETQAIGPSFQCYYGLDAGKSAFPVLFSTKALNIEDGFTFSDTYQFSIVDLQKISQFEFASSVECWVLGEGAALASSGQFSVELKQDPNGPILFSDSFGGFDRQGEFSLWKNSSRESIKRIKFELE